MSSPAVHACAGQDRANLYNEITDKIIAELEAGRVPRVQPWGTAAARAPLAMPKNASTDRSYSGINVLLLWGSTTSMVTAVKAGSRSGKRCRLEASCVRGSVAPRWSTPTVSCRVKRSGAPTRPATKRRPFHFSSALGSSTPIWRTSRSPTRPRQAKSDGGAMRSCGDSSARAKKIRSFYHREVRWAERACL